MEGDDKNPVIPRILGSLSNYGSTLLLEETPEQANMAQNDFSYFWTLNLNLGAVNYCKTLFWKKEKQHLM